MIDISKDYLLSRLDIDEIAERHNIPRDHNKLLCPYHNDHHPSLSFIPASGYKYFKCHPCGAKGSIIDFLGKINGYDDSKEQYKFALQYTGLDKLSFPDSFHHQPVVTYSRYKEKTAEEQNAEAELTALRQKVYKQLAEHLTLNDEAHEYLNKREISDQTIELYQIKSLESDKELLYCCSEEDLIKVGLYVPERPENKHSYLPHQSILFFHYTDRKTISYISNRSYNPKAVKKTLYLKGVPVLPFQGNRDMSHYQTLLLFEGIINGLSYYEMTGKQNFYCLMGLSNKKLPEILKQHKYFDIALDPDEAGQKASQKLMLPEIYYQKCVGYYPKIYDYQKLLDEHHLSFEGKYDMNDILCQIRKG